METEHSLDKASSTSNSGQSSALDQLLTDFVALSDRLLAPATQHTDVWKRATYRLTEEEVQAILESKLGDIIRGHRQVIHREPGPQSADTPSEYPIENPDEARLVAEENYYISDHPKHQALRTSFHYNLPNREFAEVRTSMEPGSTEIISFVFASEYLETGYEGHDRQVHRIDDIEELERIYQIFDRQTVDNLIPEKPIMERLAEIKTLSELEKVVGPISPGEQRLIDSANNPVIDP